MEYNQKALGKQISKYRIINGLSQKELADKVTLSQGYIGNLEIGVGKSISMNNLSNLANALNVTIDDLLVDSLVKCSSENIILNSEQNKIVDVLKTLPNEYLIFYDKMLSDFVELR